MFSSLDPQLKLHYKEKSFDQILLYPDEIQDISIEQITINNQALVGISIDSLESVDHELDIDKPSLPAYKLPEEFTAYSEKKNVLPVGKPKAKLPKSKILEEVVEEPEYLQEETQEEIQEEIHEEKPAEIKPKYIPVSTPKTIETVDAKAFLVSDTQLNASNDSDKQDKESSYEVTDGTMIFNTVFNESNFKPSYNAPFLNQNFDYSDYIDPEDETVVHLPESDIAKEVKGKSVQIIHLNNGIVLNEQFFPMDVKRVSLSRNTAGKKKFQVHDLQDINTEFIYIQNNKVFIDEVSGFNFQKYHPESGLVDVDDHSYELEYQNERVVFTKGTSQILVRITDTPPELESGNIFDVDDFLVKCIAALWIFTAIPMAIMWFNTDINLIPQKPIKEIIVIYKRKKPVEIEKIVEVKQTASEAPNKAKVEKKPEVTITKNKEQKNIKKIVKKKKIITNNMKQVKRKKTKKVTAKVAPRKVKKVKSYTFNTSSMMKSVRSKPTSTAKDVDTVNSSFNEVVGKNKYQMQKGIKNLDAKRNKMNKYGKGDIKGLKNSFGVRGISSKTNTSTSYQKTSTKILGAVDPELIRKLLREYIPHFRHCYQKELLTNPELNGIFDLDFQITAKGRGARLKILNSKTAFTRKGLNCLKTVIKRIKFPRPRGGGTVDVVQPLNFYSQTL